LRLMQIMAGAVFGLIVAQRSSASLKTLKAA